ncbi:hypothetical protein [Cupriavidus pauculus]|uniref:hypothetical protein n=1 Tax=Cupriavidus pauculus TaxID=82633 RepID=UPI001D0C5765|nr:hypothetical protein [Cupriavidus pauculus]
MPAAPATGTASFAVAECPATPRAHSSRLFHIFWNDAKPMIFQFQIATPHDIAEIEAVTIAAFADTAT